MVRRSGVGPDEVAALGNLAVAFHRAARGKGTRPEVQAFRSRLDAELAELGQEIRAVRLRLGGFRRFCIRDPKPRVIHAPVFRDRVLHHALMRVVEPVLERSLVDDTFACRPGRGSLAAVLRAQQHHRRYPWFVKVDMRSYFRSIDHAILRRALARRFKHPGLLGLCDQVLASFSDGELGRGLPIGALTSQHFANLYLGSLDRFILERLRAPGMVRYMDDGAVWATSKTEAVQTLGAIRAFVEDELRLALHPRAFVERTTKPLGFLGFQVRSSGLGLSRRRRVRYHAARRRWERAFRLGTVTPLELQRVGAALEGMVAHADSRSFRLRSLAARPSVEA